VKHKLEDELSLLQKKEAKALQQRKVRIGNKAREKVEPCGGVQQFNTSKQCMK